MKKICFVVLMLVIVVTFCSCSMFSSGSNETDIDGTCVGEFIEITLMKTSCKVNSVTECKKDSGFRVCVNITIDNKDDGEYFYASSFCIEDSNDKNHEANVLSIYVGNNETKTFNVYFDTNTQIDRTDSVLRISPGLLNRATIKLKNRDNTCAITNVDNIEIPNEKVYNIGDTATGSDNISYTVTKSYNCTKLPQKNATTEYNFLVVIFEIYNGRNAEFSLSPMDVYVFCSESKYDYSSKTHLYSDGLTSTTGVMSKTSKEFAIIFETPTSSEVDDYTIRFPVAYGDFSGAPNYIWFSV